MAIVVDEVFYLRAIVSSAILNENRTCELTNYAVYTDVYKYKNWIATSSSLELQPPLPPKNVNLRVNHPDENYIGTSK